MYMHKTILILMSAALLMYGCNYESTDTQKERAEKAERSMGDIVIGAVDTSANQSFFMKGVNLAVNIINEKGGLLGRKVKIIAFDDKGDIDTAQRIARQLSANTDVVAVVGHLFSSVAVPASITYAQNGILFITPGATNPLLTAPRSPFIFRNIPTDSVIGFQLADFAKASSFKSIAIFYQRDADMKALTDRFQERAGENGISVVATRSFFKWQNDFRDILSELKDQYKFDCIFIAGILPSPAYIIKQARDMGIKAPVLGPAGLDSPSLLTIAGKAAEGTVVATVFNPKYPGKATQDFIDRFQTEYGFEPDTWAAQGYDAVSVLSHAIDEAGSVVPIVVGATLRYLKDWEGVTGSYSFNTKGDIEGKSIYFKQVQDGKFAFLKSEDRVQASLFDYVEGFTLRLPMERPIPTIDPGLTVEKVSIEVTEQLFLGLTDLDPETYEAVPELATHWEAGQDGRKYTFYLRNDVKWTDGRPVTAHDVVWAIRRNIDAKTKSPGWYMLQIIKNAEAFHNGQVKDVAKLGVRALDDYTVEFELEHEASFFPTIAGIRTYYPLPREAIEKFGEQWTDPDKIITNGSYKLALWEKGVGMVLVKNPDYYEADSVSIPEVRYFVIPQGNLGLAMYENNELDIMGSGYSPIPLEDIPDIKANPVLSKEYSLENQFCTYAYAFNTQRKPVDNPLVRKAIAAAVGRHLMIDVLAGGDLQIATTFTSPPIFGAVDPKAGIGIRFNPVQARKWLAEAGYPDGKDFPNITLLYSASEKNTKFARAVKASLSHFLNINLELREKRFENFFQIITNNNPPHLFLLDWCADYPDAYNFLNVVFKPSKSLYRFGWNDPRFEDLMMMAEKELNPLKRKNLYRKAEKILCEEEAIVIPIYFDTAHCLVKPRIGGWYHMGIGGQHIRNWHLLAQ